jgi:hypothetical protein
VGQATCGQAAAVATPASPCRGTGVRDASPRSSGIVGRAELWHGRKGFAHAGIGGAPATAVLHRGRPRTGLSTHGSKEPCGAWRVCAGRARDARSDPGAGRGVACGGGEGSQPLAWLGVGSRNPHPPGQQPCLSSETGEGREVGERRETGERERKRAGLNGFFSKFGNDTLKSANIKVVGNFKLYNFCFSAKFI